MKDKFSRFYDEVYSQDNPSGDCYGWIQWKGTEVCIDLHCKCGYHSHFDGDFFYYFECPKCHKRYAVGQNVKLIELTEKQIKLGEVDGSFQKGELDIAEENIQI